MTLEDIKRNGCSAAFALPVFFSLYGGLTLLFGGLATVELKTEPHEKNHYRAGLNCVYVGAALVAFALCYATTYLWIVPALHSKAWLIAKLRMRSMLSSMTSKSEDRASEGHSINYSTEQNAADAVVETTRIKSGKRDDNSEDNDGGDEVMGETDTVSMIEKNDNVDDNTDVVDKQQDKTGVIMSVNKDTEHSDLMKTTDRKGPRDTTDKKGMHYGVKIDMDKMEDTDMESKTNTMDSAKNTKGTKGNMYGNNEGNNEDMEDTDMESKTDTMDSAKNTKGTKGNMYGNNEDIEDTDVVSKTGKMDKKDLAKNTKGTKGNMYGNNKAVEDTDVVSKTGKMDKKDLAKNTKGTKGNMYGNNEDIEDTDMVSKTGKKDLAKNTKGTKDNVYGNNEDIEDTDMVNKEDKMDKKDLAKNTKGTKGNMYGNNKAIEDTDVVSKTGKMDKKDLAKNTKGTKGNMYGNNEDIEDTDMVSKTGKKDLAKNTKGTKDNVYGNNEDIEDTDMVNKEDKMDKKDLAKNTKGTKGNMYGNNEDIEDTDVVNKTDNLDKKSTKNTEVMKIKKVKVKSGEYYGNHGVDEYRDDTDMVDKGYNDRSEEDLGGTRMVDKSDKVDSDTKEVFDMVIKKGEKDEDDSEGIRKDKAVVATTTDNGEDEVNKDNEPSKKDVITTRVKSDGTCCR